MRLKTFQARTMSEAMRQIKAELGDDAIIVNSRDAPGGVRVTAAAEPKAASFEQALVEAEDDGYTGEEIIELVSDALLKHRVPGQVSEKIIAAALVKDTEDPHAALAWGLEKTFGFADPAPAAPAALMLVGPPGAGKTLMAAKLAARAALDGQRPAVITTDTERAGAVEQLGAFLDILELPLHRAADSKTLSGILAERNGTAPIIVDTGGLNPFDPQEMRGLARLLAAGKAAHCAIEAALVLPAGIDAEESAEMAMTFEILGVRRLIPTRLDFARRIGGILSAADRGGLFFGEASHTPRVADGILMLDTAALSKLLMPHVPEKKEKSNRRGRTKARKGKA
jgi:flagellar biosynthesis protein FlhF